MENKHNFTGIIIPVIVAVILLTVLPIVNSINVECPPCEECPSYDIGQLNINPDFSSGNYIVDKGSYDYIDSATIIKDDDLIPENIKKDVDIFGIVGTYEETGGSDTYEYVLPITADNVVYGTADSIHLTILFAPKNSQTIINDKYYYHYKSTIFINYELAAPGTSREDWPISTEQHFYYIYWEDFTENTLIIQAPFNSDDYDCLGIFFAEQEMDGDTTLLFDNEVAYKQDKVTTTSINNGGSFSSSFKTAIAVHTLQGETRSFISNSINYYYLPKLGSQELFVEYND